MFDLSTLRRPYFAFCIAPAMRGFREINKAALADGVISMKHKELIGVAMALTPEFDYFRKVRPKSAVVADVTKKELVKATFVVLALRTDAAFTHGSHLMADPT